jgi:hypothetical protein
VIKLLRIKKGFKLFDVAKIMAKFKNHYKEKIQAIIEENHELANSIEIDNNKIEEILRVSYILKTMRLTMVLINISFLTGVFWLLLCEFIQDFVYDVDPGDQDFDEDLFMVTFGIEKKGHFQNIILVTYFAITSLATVGFGDYHPRGDAERVFTALILLFGVAIFSYIMGIFIEILDKISQFNADLDDGDNLAKFFGILRKFNN